jgi:hypothetical protein
MFKKKSRKRSRRDLKAVVDKRKKGDDLDFDADETTDIIDLAMEKAKRSAEACQEEVRSTAETIKTIRLPKPGPTEEAV